RLGPRVRCRGARGPGGADRAPGRGHRGGGAAFDPRVQAGDHRRCGVRPDRRPGARERRSGRGDPGVSRTPIAHLPGALMEKLTRDAPIADRAPQIIRRLQDAYPNATVALHFTNPLEMLVATILSAQCTDERVNQVTKTLFVKYRTPEDY